MQPYVIKQGDYVGKIAAHFGFEESTVWLDPKNEALRKRRKDPNQLVAGDVLYVPESAPPKWWPVKVGAVNTFVAPRVKRVKMKVRFVADGKPLANERYALEGVVTKNGQTDGEGNVECDVPVTASAIQVRFVNRREVFTVHVGHLDPADEPSGAYQRLVALGMFGRPQGGIPGNHFSADSLAQALLSFQRANELPPTGELDESTRARLVELHGS